MTHSTNSTKHTEPATHYSIYRDKDGVDESFEIVCNITGKSVARLPFWYEDTATLRETRAFITALDRMHRRGGYFCIESFAQSNEAIVEKYYQPEILHNHDEPAV